MPLFGESRIEAFCEYGDNMETIRGKIVCPGIALGSIYVLQKNRPAVRKEKCTDPEAEIALVNDARAAVIAQLRVLYEQAVAEVGIANAAIFQVHEMLLRDAEFIRSIELWIREGGMNAQWAVAEAGYALEQKFEHFEDEYMRSRCADIHEVTDRLLKQLMGNEESDICFKEPVILVADTLTPGETVKLDTGNILAFVINNGTVNSHAAIFAKNMNIPTLMGIQIDIDKLRTDTLGLVDAISGEFILEPDEERVRYAEQLLRDKAGAEALLQELKGKPDVTRSGKRLDVYANVGSEQELELALANDAMGIGLLRSEFLFIGRESAPTEEEQFVIYRRVAEKMAGKRVVIRTLDMGADKQADYLRLEAEENPALGYRGIRILLTRKDLFVTQLRAIYRAAVYGQLAVLYPMIISKEEVEAIQEITAQVKADLEAQGLAFGEVEEGIMVETPAAALISDELAEQVDFFSIGTNDLTQYTLVIDRQNAKLDDFYNPHHKAVLKMIKMVAENVHKAGKKVGICGELAADEALTEEFIRMDIDQLSVAPSKILHLRKRIRDID